MPPERGMAPASSATVSAPHSAITPPSTQHSSIGPGWCSCPATVAGTRKMPLPMVMPTDTVIVCNRLTERGMRSPHWSAIREPRREQLHPVAHRDGRAAAQVYETTDVGGGDDLRVPRFQRLHLRAQQLAGQLRLQQRVAAGRAAAPLTVRDR